MYEEISKLSLQRDPSDDTAMKQRLSDNVGQLIDPNHVSLLKSAVVNGQPLGQTLHGAPYAWPLFGNVSLFHLFILNF